VAGVDGGSRLAKASEAPRALGIAADPVERLLTAFSQEHGTSKHTLAAYLGDLDHFTQWAGFKTRVEMVRALLKSPPGAVNGKVIEYRRHLMSTPMEGRTQPASPATINRRLSALRSLTRLGRTLGVINWTIEVPNVRYEQRRDTKGPSLEEVRKLFDAAEAQKEPKASRDVAILRLLFDLGLRSFEVRELDVRHFDPVTGRLQIKGKGRREREAIETPAPTRAALERWLSVRGAAPGALFTSLNRKNPGRRISRAGFVHLIYGLGEAAGVDLSPHGLRHTSITLVVKAKGLAVGQAHARHKNPSTTSRYVDNKKEMAAAAAAELAELIK